MTRRFRSTRKFEKQFTSLDKSIRKQAIKAIELFVKDPAHPSLRLKKVKGTDCYYEISVNMSITIIIEIKKSSNSDQINTFYFIGKHEDVFPLD